MMAAASGDNKNAAMAATSSAVDTRFKGWRSALASRFASEDSNAAAKGVSVRSTRV